MSDTVNLSPDYPQSAAAAEIWAILRETAESQRKFDQRMKEETAQRMEEADKRIQETDKRMQEANQRMEEADRRMKEETDQRMREANQRMEEADRRMKEENELRTREANRRLEEADRLLEETKRIVQETAKQMKETDKRVGELTNRFGELAEHLVAPSIMEKFNALDFTFETVSQNFRIKDSTGNSLAEIDIMLENGDVVMAVEIKAKPLHKDVDDHINRLEVLRRRADARQDRRRFQGAIAGAIMSGEVRNHILKNGFYAIEQTGDTVKITIPEGFKAREW